MIIKELFFYSNGYRLKSTMYLPDDYKEGEKRSCIVANSGYMGLNVIYPALYARALTERGFIVFGFDYRGFLDNEGPAGVCKLEEQVEDIRNAVVFVSTLTEVNENKIGLLGWGMAGALVMKASAYEKRVKAVAGLNGFYNGDRWLSMINSYTDFIAIKKEIEQEKIRMVLEGTRKFANPFYFYPLDPATSDVVRDNLYTVKNYGQEISLEVGQSILEFNAEDVLDKIDIPVFIGHGKENLLHPFEEAKLFYENIWGEKEFYTIDGKHNDFMFDNHPVFIKLIDKLEIFFSKM